MRGELAPEALDGVLGPGRDELARLVPQLGSPRAPVADASWTASPLASSNSIDWITVPPNFSGVT